jgi:hypothetical protein
MENQNNTQPTQPLEPQATSPVASQPQVDVPSVPEAPKPKAKIKDQVKETYLKVKDKKMFKILAVLFGIIFLLIVVGSIYSIVKNSNRNQAVLPSPSPQATAPVMLTEESKKSKSTLEELKSKILNLDVNQKHLTPPNIDFDISF